MALNKVNYVDGQTVITAENLNDIQEAIIALENAPAQGLTEDMKQALLQLARKVAYIDDQGQTYYDDLYDALYPPKTVVLITAVFNQGSTVIYDDTALDDLKQYLTVTAKYDDNTTAILADSAYTLSGLLEAGTSTVTVAYNGLTTTFTVNVTARPTLSSISAVYTQSGTVYDTDTLDSLKADLVVTAHYSDSSTQTVPAADYTLSGTLTAGTSTITVSYGGKTATFSVTVTAWDLNWDYTMGAPSVAGLVVDVESRSSATMESDGLHVLSRDSVIIARSTNFTANHGVAEFDLTFTDMPDGYQGLFFGMSDGTHGARVRIYSNKITLGYSATNDEAHTETIYSGVSVNTPYLIRFEWDISNGFILSINGETVYTLNHTLDSPITRLVMTAIGGGYVGDNAYTLRAYRAKAVS